MCILGILEKISPSKLVYNGYIKISLKNVTPMPKIQSLFLFMISAVSDINVTQITLKTSKEKYKESFLIVCFQLK